MREEISSILSKSMAARYFLAKIAGFDDEDCCTFFNKHGCTSCSAHLFRTTKNNMCPEVVHLGTLKEGIYVRGIYVHLETLKEGICAQLQYSFNRHSVRFQYNVTII